MMPAAAFLGAAPVVELEEPEEPEEVGVGDDPPDVPEPPPDVLPFPEEVPLEDMVPLAALGCTTAA